jgi:hypothetical protein
MTSEFPLSSLAARVKNLQQSGPRLFIAYVLLCVLIFALQFFSIPGFLLVMLFATALWIGLVVHVAMVHFAYLAVTRTISRAWLALPLGFYAGGYTLHVASIHAAEAEAAAINARNAGIRLAVDQPFRYFRDYWLDPLIEHYRVDRSFTRDGNGFNMIYYARGADCDNARQNYDYQRRNEPWLFRGNVFAYYPGDKARQCILSQYVSSAEWRYRITGKLTSEKDQAFSLYDRYGRVFEIFDDRDKRMLGTVEVAAFRTFTVVPFIIAGCGLIGGPEAKWECGWGLMKGKTSIAGGYKLRAADDPQHNPFIPSLDPETWEVTPLARALGLVARQPTD